MKFAISRAAASLAVLFSWGAGAAGVTDVSQQPLLVSSGITIKPNLMFILDDSGSMAETYLPEAAYKSRFLYAHRASQCNGLAFDPANNYERPMTWDRNDYANASAPTMAADVDMENIRSTTQGAVSVTAGGEIILTVSHSGSNWSTGGTQARYFYSVGNHVTVYNNSLKTDWAVGTVVSWSTATSNTAYLKIKITEVRGGGTLSLGSPRVADGYPFFFYFTYSGTQPRLNYLYTSSGNLNTSVTAENLFHTECSSSIGSLSVFSAPVNVLTASTEVKTRFYNWYAYHFDRMKMMKTVVSRAFSAVDDRFRIGFNTILNTTARETFVGGGVNSRFLHVRDFKETREPATPAVPSQREKFYTALMATPPTNTTPLRASLSMAGRYFANKLGSGQDYDPIQYSCQKNFVILSTDGAWNTGAESGSFGPYQLNGSTLVGQQDAETLVAGEPNAAVLQDSKAGYSNSLADVAMYYYKTDLRTPTLSNCVGNIPGIDVCQNNVKKGDVDTATHQHLNTYTLSLGQNGSIKYEKDYLKSTTGDYAKIAAGTLRWPDPTTDAYKVDDLWHAAVNGRGQFFNGSDARSVSDGIKEAIQAIAGQTGSGSAAAASTLRPVAGNNLAFIAEFSTGSWVGDVRAYEIKLDTGDIQRASVRDKDGKDNEKWSAARRLKEGGFTRRLLVAKGGALVDFTYDNAKDGGHLDNKCSLLSQCISLTSTQRDIANDGRKLVQYLSGVDFLGVFRKRDGELLGDIVSSAPVYDGPIASRYADEGYAEFAKTRLSRKPVVYVGSNDGFMHAFYAGTADDEKGRKPGQEMWAFSPTVLRQHLYKLADDDYSNKHRYFVDGPATLADVTIDGSWKTILVFGLGAGGNQYTALDVTDPESPKLLWEFTHANLGMTHAKPIITKRKSTGAWVVAVPSGFNNTTGDGKGHLFLLNVKTGAIVEDMVTKGDAANPTGLGPLNSWVDSDADNTALRYYAGDNSGNVWRFDTEGLLGPKGAVLLAEFGDKQPITTAPVLAEVDYKGIKNPVVYVGTGRSVGLSDLTDASLQSIYGIKDPLTGTGWGALRGSGKLVEQKLVVSGEVRTVTKNPVDWAKDVGWQVDLTDPASQRINVPMQLFGNTLIAAANVPMTVGTCEKAGDGTAYLYFIDIASGGADNIDFIPQSQVAGFTVLTLPNGKSVVSVIPVKGDDVTEEVKPAASYSNKASRANWRTLSGR